jgi:hypothetical protein
MPLPKLYEPVMAYVSPSGTATPFGANWPATSGDGPSPNACWTNESGQNAEK